MTDERTDGSVPLITLPRRGNNYQRLSDDNFDPFDDYDTAYRGSQHHHYQHDHDQQQEQEQEQEQQQQQQQHRRQQYPSGTPTAQRPLFSNMRLPTKGSKKGGLAIISSYVFDWVIVIVFLGVAYYMDHHAPNRRPFFLEDPNISFPFTEHETVPPWLLITLAVGVPIVVIPIISLIFVPGHTVPRGTPRSLVWKRKLWELHVGWLGLGLAIAATWFVTNGMKNLFGKPRPDLLARCNPDLDAYARYIVGGLDVADGYQRLVSADICRGMVGRDDAQDLLEDGFRSYPSGHSSSSAAGLIYLSLFIASKFAITFPFLAPGSHNYSPIAFPSRRPQAHHMLSQSARGGGVGVDDPQDLLHGGGHHQADTRHFAAYNQRLSSVRQQAAAPPLYLLTFAVAPFATAVFIASSRWFDFRHHGFDILFGFLIGTVCAFFAFRWYHLPVSQGAGWAWGPRCADKAWWAGVGSFSYATDWDADDGGGGGAPGGGYGGGETGLRGRMGGDDEVAAMEEGLGGMHKAGLSMATTGSDGVSGDVEDADARRRLA